MTSEKTEKATNTLTDLAWKAYQARKRYGADSGEYQRAIVEMERARRLLDVIRGGVA